MMTLQCGTGGAGGAGRQVSELMRTACPTLLGNHTMCACMCDCAGQVTRYDPGYPRGLVRCVWGSSPPERYPTPNPVLTEPARETGSDRLPETVDSRDLPRSHAVT